MAWQSLTKVADFAEHLTLEMAVLQNAKRQRSHIYVEKKGHITKKGKPRDLCYPPHRSDLWLVQKAIKDKCLPDLLLSDAVQGYRIGRHNINTAQKVAGLAYVAKLDIKAFHPSITPTLVSSALQRQGVSRPMCRLITQLVTYKNAVPQGASTSNHIANLVIDFVLAQGILEFCAVRGVVVVNYGDDTAFGGAGRRSVDECVDFAKEIFRRNRLVANSKSSQAEHVGASRRFIGTATGRQVVDLPRKKFRLYRIEFRAALKAERADSEKSCTTQEQLRSLRAKIGYVRRLNPHKARYLAEIFYRLCRIKRDKIKARQSLDATVA